MLIPAVDARNRGKPIVSQCQHNSRSLIAIEAECPSRMPRTWRALIRGWSRTFFLVTLLTGARAGAALPPTLGLSQIQHRAWTAKQGSPPDIGALAQSPDGFLLLGTGSVLCRFDGGTFERVIPSNQSDLGYQPSSLTLSLRYPHLVGSDDSFFLSGGGINMGRYIETETGALVRLQLGSEFLNAELR